jgi:glycosyltransferase involved in cell wall biosynthesis
MNLRMVHYYPRAWVGDGGCTASVRGWASALAETGAQVTVVSDGNGEPPPIRNVRWTSTPHRWWGRMRLPVGLERILEGQDLLVLHSGWSSYNLAAARAAVRMGVPYVLMPHGAYEPNVFRRRSTSKQLWWRLFEHQLVTAALAIHVFFEEQIDELRQIGYAGPVVVAPNGISMPDFARGADRAEYLLWMGRFDIETKGLDLLLNALASLDPSARPRLRLHGPDWRGGKQQTAQLVRELGLEDVVAIGPPLYGSQKWEALRECGLFVFPARWDAQSVMVLEAAAAGAPLLVTSTTPIGRMMAAQKAALLVDATPEAIASGITKGLSSEAAALGVRASEVVRERFSWPAVAEHCAQQLRGLM